MKHINKIIGLTFPSYQKGNNRLEPSIINVLPDGDNVLFVDNKNTLKDNEIKYYICSIYISGYKEFLTWSKKINKNKIIVGGYHPTMCPEDFKNKAFKIVTGLCDDFYTTIKQPGEIVKGITNFKHLPRYNLFNTNLIEQSIPDKYKNDIVRSLNTSYGCTFKCDFCCTPFMSSGLISKPISLLKLEIEQIKKDNPQFIFIRDENFLLQKDWVERLNIIASLKAKIYLFSSANLLNEAVIRTLKSYNVYMICLGLEDITQEYGKNLLLEGVCKQLYDNNIHIYLSFIVNPLKMVDLDEEKKFYKQLTLKFYDLRASMVCGNFLMPFPKTVIWKDYKHLVTKKDYQLYNSKTAFLIKDLDIRRRVHFNMFKTQLEYYNSYFYNKFIRIFNQNDMLFQKFEDLKKDFNYV